MPSGSSIGFGLIFVVGSGVAFAVALDDWAVGTARGIGLGIVFGSAHARRRRSTVPIVLRSIA